MKIMKMLIWLILLLSTAAGSNDSRHESVDDPGAFAYSFNEGSHAEGSERHSRPNDSAVNGLAAEQSHGLQPGSQARGIGRVAVQSPGLRSGSFRYGVGDGFYFHRQRSAGGRSFLRCILSRANPPCPVRASMNDDLSGFLVTSGLHNHGPDQLHERVQQLRDSLLEACRARPNVRVDLIYHEVCRKDVSNRVSLLSMRPTMVRVQAERRPRVPYSFEALDEMLGVNEELRQSLDGEELLYRGMTGAEGHHSLIFMSSRVVDGIGPVSHLFGDATFYSRPNHPAAAQLYSFVTMRDNHVVFCPFNFFMDSSRESPCDFIWLLDQQLQRKSVIPLFHALMESRTEQAYRDVFAMFRRLAPFLDPEFLVTDFERAQQVALHDTFPRARLTGCLWHYSRAVCRNVRVLGLHALVRDTEDARRIVRMSMGIPLVPANRLQEALNAVVIESRRLHLLDQFQGFFHYIRETWILGVGQSLSVFGVRHRTNNVAECHHRNLNARLVRRPNIWRFLELLSESEDTAWRDLGRIEVGLAPSRGRRLSSLLNDARIRSLSRQLIHREMDMAHFLAAVSYHLEGTMRTMLVEREDQERPPSPERAPPPRQPDEHRNGHNNSLCPNSDADMESGIFEPFPPANPVSVLHQVDAAALFDDLLEDNYSVGPVARGRGRGRGRRQRGRSVLRGQGRGPSYERNHIQPPSLSASSQDNFYQRNPTQSPSLPDLSQRNHAQPPHVNRQSLRSEDFSDEELLPEDYEEEVGRWQQCLVCFTRVGRYTIIGCGAFPVCGFCIRQWFVTRFQPNCPHCAGPTPGWLRLDI